MKFVIIGSQGLLGKSLHKNLNKTNLLLIDKAYKKNKNYIKFDLTKKFNFIKLKDKEADVAILLAFFKTQPEEFFNTSKKAFINTNKKILKNSLKICKILKVKKIIYFSSPAVYAINYKDIKIKENFIKKPKNIYGKFKLFAEKETLRFGKQNKIKVINLRLFNYFDNKGNHLIETFKKQKINKKIIVYGNGLQKRDFTHVDDICQSIILIGKKKVKSGNYNLCTSKGITINNILKRYVLKKNDKTKINYIGWRHQKADILIGDNTKLKNLINFRISKTIL